MQADLFESDIVSVPAKLTRIRRRVIDAAVDMRTPSDNTVVPEFLHSVLCQLSLPRNQTDARIFERSSGRVSIRIKAGELFRRLLVR